MMNTHYPAEHLDLIEHARTDTMTHVAYIRVSSVDQNTERQLADCGVEFTKTFTDKASGGSTKRPALEQLQEYVREGDTVHVHSIDRLARNITDLQTLVNDWRQRGVSVRFHKEGLQFNSAEQPRAMDELLLSMLGAVAQFERSMIRERQAEGIAKAKEAGKYKGGVHKKLSDNVRDAVLADLAAGKSIRKTAADHGIGISSVQRIKKEAE